MVDTRQYSWLLDAGTVIAQKVYYLTNQSVNTVGIYTSIDSNYLHAGLSNNFTKFLLIHEIFYSENLLFQDFGLSTNFFTTKIWSHTVYNYRDSIHNRE